MLCKLYKGHLQVNAIQIIDQKKKERVKGKKGRLTAKRIPSENEKKKNMVSQLSKRTKN